MNDLDRKCAELDAGIRSGFAAGILSGAVIVVVHFFVEWLSK